ncbi:MAG: metal-dependent hydrolase [Gammaproteobacteria bacterium]|nr:metal-dependent hydrolase [Gammaproteobacteria bacterium]
MKAGTHIAFASTLYLAGATVFGYATDPAGWAIACATANLPDVDLPTSRVGRALFFVSTRLERRFGHRTLTHSLTGLAAFALLLLPLWLFSPLWYGCALGGYWSHMWLDMANIRGVDLLWPSPIRVVMPGRRAWRMEVGSKAEMVLFVLLIVVALGLYPLSGLGFRGTLQLAIGNFEIARDEFRHRAGSHWYTLELEATDNLTLQHIRCHCPVLGVWQEGLIVLYKGQLRAVGESQAHHDLYPLRARLIEGAPLTVIAQRVDMRGRSLRWLVSRIDPARTYYLLGEMEMAGDKPQPVGDLDLYRPVSYRGQALRLHYARAEELEPWLDLVAAQGEVYVQFWLKPGEAQVEVYGGQEDRPAERVPAELRRFL